MKRLLFSLSIIVLAGCGSQDKVDQNTLMASDFESIQGWLPDLQNPTLTRDKAHSGKYSIKIDPTYEYSLTYRANLGQLSSARVKKMKISAWVFVPNAQAQAALVTTIDGAEANGQPLLWEAANMSESVRGQFNKWVEITKEIVVPAEATYTSRISIYLWRSGSVSAPVYLDDLAVQLVP
ncbi:hypothetical protein MTX78_21550 [Hymenobacter tibetensis]|uniref:CBM-cenC domain-containing protein n=1 Tax=Hymenobacter tibetensis TaxID=497967 RepID=A0ABY4CWP8_9BACT|nr:hypothetical protein [Hymenobacter tibetensis]UOG74690.1 hypothetical protein MTX78_21550 [Hymenobacter tibetensis]